MGLRPWRAPSEGSWGSPDVAACARHCHLRRCAGAGPGPVGSGTPQTSSPSQLPPGRSRSRAGDSSETLAAGRPVEVSACRASAPDAVPGLSRAGPAPTPEGCPRGGSAGTACAWAGDVLGRKPARGPGASAAAVRDVAPAEHWGVCCAPRRPAREHMRRARRRVSPGLRVECATRPAEPQGRTRGGCRLAHPKVCRTRLPCLHGGFRPRRWRHPLSNVPRHC